MAIFQVTEDLFLFYISKLICNKSIFVIIWNKFWEMGLDISKLKCDFQIDNWNSNIYIVKTEVLVLKSIHFLNSSAQGSCFHKLTVDGSTG